MNQAQNNDNSLQQSFQMLDILSERTGAIVAALDVNFRYTYINYAYKDEIIRLSGRQIQVGMSLSDAFDHMPAQLKTAIEEWQLRIKWERDT